MANDKMEAAQKLLAERMPYLSPVIYRLRFRERPNVPSVSYAHGRVYYNEGYLVSKDVEELAGDLMQIVAQVLGGQASRRHGRDPYIWYLACLAETGDDARDSGFPRALESVVPEFWKFEPGMTAEQYYALLMEMDFIDIPFNARRLDGTPLTTDGRLRIPNPEKDFSEDDVPEMPLMPGSEMFDEDDPEGVAPWEDAPPTEPTEMWTDPLLMGGVEDEVEQEIEDWEKMGHGTVPDWARRPARVIRQKDDWRRRLERLVGDSMRWGSNSVTFTWTKPSLIQHVVSSGARLPSFQHASPSVAVVIDTSDSMQKDERGNALGQLDAVLRGMGISEGVTVFCADSTAKDVQKVFSAAQLELIGGGGTDMRAGLSAAKLLRPQPDCVIVMTDGYTPWPEKRPGRLQVIVVNVSRRWPKNKQDQEQYPMPTWSKNIIMFPKGRVAG